MDFNYSAHHKHDSNLMLICPNFNVPYSDLPFQLKWGCQFVFTEKYDECIIWNWFAEKALPSVQVFPEATCGIVANWKQQSKKQFVHFPPLVSIRT